MKGVENLISLIKSSPFLFGLGLVLGYILYLVINFIYSTII